jgi:DHA1 family bicyclomycin/chloramphenicol resistance-like MFS transporter
VHSGTQLARFYSLLTAATAIAPMVAPIAGAGLLESGLSWRWI